jgi:hypothetical protein
MVPRDATDDRLRKKSSESDSKSNVAVKGNSGREGATDTASNTISNALDCDRPQLYLKESDPSIKMMNLRLPVRKDFSDS